MQRTLDCALEEWNSIDMDIDGAHILMSLTYIGKNTSKNNGILLARTLEQWRRNNEKLNVTTALVINDDYLIQNIEGTRPVINKLLAKLINEYSHLLPNIIDIEEREVRRWDGFLIKYLTSSAQDEQYILKNFSAGADFNPYLMKRTQIMGFIEDVFKNKELSKFQKHV